MHTAFGVTIWTYGPMGRRYAMVRRDSDGLRLTREEVNKPVKWGRMKMLYQEFSDLVTPEFATFVNRFNPRKATDQERDRMRKYMIELDALMRRHITKETP